jgi:hypothetical protein
MIFLDLTHTYVYVGFGEEWYVCSRVLEEKQKCGEYIVVRCWVLMTPELWVLRLSGVYAPYSYHLQVCLS